MTAHTFVIVYIIFDYCLSIFIVFAGRRSQTNKLCILLFKHFMLPKGNTKLRHNLRLEYRLTDVYKTLNSENEVIPCLT